MASSTHFQNKLLLPFGVAVTVLLSILQFCSCHSYLEETPCGVLYSWANYSGPNYTISDQTEIENLHNSFHVFEGRWGTTGSLKIEQACSMKVCSESFFEGTCQTLKSGSYPVTTGMTVSNISSATCVCAKQCKCSSVLMKRNSCARAYLKGGCSKCHASYTDLDRPSFDSNPPPIPEEFSEKVEAFRIRSGCTLTIYPEEDFQGDEIMYDQQVVENYNGTIGSYECECNDDNFVPPHQPTSRPHSYPPSVEIPTTLDDVINALSSQEYAEHPGFRAAFKSLKSGRSSKNFYILLLGSAGSGKKSAMNILFDNPNVIRVIGCGTSEIREYRIPVRVDDLGVANSELRIIYVPGFGDTRGLDQDARMLATLDSFLENHEELKYRIPNIVLIFQKYNDNRFTDKDAQFVKMLRAFESFGERIIDQNNSNVIFVLSHFCSDTRANQKKPEAKLNRFKKVIQDYTYFPRPILITVAENNAKYQELPMLNGYFKLPNNEYYPRNLFEKIELVARNGGDLMGLEILRTAFRNSDNFNVTSTRFQQVDRSSNKHEYYLQALSNHIFPVGNKTEISQILQQVWDEKVNIRLRKQFPSSLYYLQMHLINKNITIREDIPKTFTATRDLLSKVRQDEVTLTLLQVGMNLKLPVFNQDAVAGFSYNVFTDSYLPKSPFMFGDKQLSDIGFLVPNALTCNLKFGSKFFLSLFDNKEQYIEHRIKSLIGIEGTIAKENFTGILKPGHNVKELSFTMR